MVDRSESAAPNQIAKFKELLQTAKDSRPENQALGLERITIDTPVYFDFAEILDEFDDSIRKWSQASGETAKVLSSGSSLVY